MSDSPRSFRDFERPEVARAVFMVYLRAVLRGQTLSRADLLVPGYDRSAVVRARTQLVEAGFIPRRTLPGQGGPYGYPPRFSGPWPADLTGEEVMRMAAAVQWDKQESLHRAA